MAVATSIILIAAGVIFGLFGYAVYRLWAAFSGLVIGLAAGILFGNQYFDGAVWPVIAGALLGLAMAGVFYYYRLVGAIAAGAGTGFVLALLVIYAFGSGNWPLALVGAAFGGVCAAVFFKPFIAAGTSFGGAAAVVIGLYALFTGVNLYGMSLSTPIVSGPAAVVLLMATGILGAVALSVQTLLLRRRRAVEEERARRRGW